MDQGFFAHSVLQCNEEAGTLYVGLHLTDILNVVITLNLQQQIVHLVHWNYQPNPKDEQSKIRNETDIHVPCTTTSNNSKSFIHLFGWENILKTQPLFHEKKKHLIFFNMQYRLKQLFVRNKPQTCSYEPTISKFNQQTEQRFSTALYNNIILKMYKPITCKSTWLANLHFKLHVN